MLEAGTAGDHYFMPCDPRDRSLYDPKDRAPYDPKDRAAEYILKAEWCAAQAKVVKSTAERDTYLNMEKGWRELAALVLIQKR